MSSERYWDYDTELLPLCKALMEMSIYERPITPLTVLGETGLARSVNAVYCKINRIVNSMYKAAWHSDTNGTSRANDCRKALIEAGFDLDGLPELIDTRKIRGRQKKHSTRSKQSKGSPNGHVDFSAAFAVVPTITDLVLQTNLQWLARWEAIKERVGTFTAEQRAGLYGGDVAAKTRYQSGGKLYEFGPPRKYIEYWERVFAIKP